MKGSANYVIGSIAALLLAVWMVACTSVQEQPKPAAPAVAQQPAPPATQEGAESAEPNRSPAKRRQRRPKRKPSRWKV